MSNENPNRDPLGEASVLDYVKSLCRFDGERIRIPEFVEEEQFSEVSSQYAVAEAQPEITVATQPATFESFNVQTAFPWRSLLGFFIALLAQRLFEPPSTVSPLGYAFYIGALALIGWAVYRREWRLPALAESSSISDPMTYNPW